MSAPLTPSLRASSTLCIVPCDATMLNSVSSISHSKHSYL
jgi:hypothetical protein